MNTITGIELGILYSSTAGAAIFGLIFLYLFWQSREEYLKSFAIFWGFSALTLLSATAMYAALFQPVSDTVYFIGIILAGVFLLKGSRGFFEQKASKYWYILAVIVLGLGIVSASIMESEVIPLILAMTYLGLAYLIAGTAFLKNSRTITLKTTGGAAVIFAIGTFIFPYISQQDWFVPAGSTFLGGVGTFFGLGLVGAYYERLQDKVVKMRDRYKNVVNTQEELIFRFKPDTTLTFVNQASCKNIGLSKKDIIGRKYIEFIPDEDREFALGQLEKAKKGQEPQKYEHKVEAEGGETRYLRWVNYPIYNDAGEIEEFQAVGMDITERKKMEEKLRIREEQYRKIFESAPIGMELKNSEGIIIDVNEKLCEITGYEREELIGESQFETLVPEAYKERARDDFNKVLSGKELEQILPSRHKSGKHYFVNLKDTKIQLPEGEEGVLSMRTDITDRLEAEKELKEEKEKFQSLAETSPFALFVYREKFQYVNSVLTDMTGYSREELLDMNFWEVVVPEHREMAKERGYALQKGEDFSSNYELKLQKKNGEEMWILFSVAQINYYKGEKAGIGTAIDISDRKKAEEQLRIREELYRKIFQTSPVGIILEDCEGNILEVNDILCKMSGYSEEELVGKNVLKTLTPSDQKEKARKNINRILAGKNLEFVGEGRKKSGERYYVHISETKAKLPRGEEGILSIHLDITELKEKEDELRYLSYHDGLTGLYNRIYLKEEMQRLDTERQLPISLIMCDVNGLKLVNDTYGHKKGDELLIKVAEILRETTREEDIVTRWAGDEFVIFLPQTNAEMARKISKRIEEACGESEFNDISITLGIGVATKENIETDLKEVLSRADKRMYKDKLNKPQYRE